MRAIDSDIGERVTYMKWYIDANNLEGKTGTITGYDETGRECTYIEVLWDDGKTGSIQEDGLKKAPRTKK